MTEEYTPISVEAFVNQIGGLPDGYDDLYIDVVVSVARQLLQKVMANGSITAEEAAKIVDDRTCELEEYFQGEMIYR